MRGLQWTSKWTIGSQEGIWREKCQICGRKRIRGYSHLDYNPWVNRGSEGGKAQIATINEGLSVLNPDRYWTFKNGSFCLVEQFDPGNVPVAVP